jgi:hypothetical protein
MPETFFYTITINKKTDCIQTVALKMLISIACPQMAENYKGLNYSLDDANFIDITTIL